MHIYTFIASVFAFFFLNFNVYSHIKLIDQDTIDKQTVLSSVPYDHFTEDEIILIKSNRRAPASSVQDYDEQVEEIVTKEIGDSDQDVINEEEVPACLDEGDEDEQAIAVKNALNFTYGAVQGKFQVKYKPESFYARNANLLNSNIDADSIYYSRATIDMNLGLGWGKDYYGHSAVNFFMTVRNQATWGNPESIARTTRTRIKTLDFVDAGHQHAITKHILWLRELWLDFSITDALNLPCSHDHIFKLGAFPFELGRGISLGSAYAVSPGFLGFFSDNTINQYAYGFKFAGTIVDSLQYDLYAAILRNQMDSFAVTAENVLGQQYGRQLNPELGSGRLDFILAGRMRWYPIKSETASAAFEPYVLYNNVPSQTVEFPNDAAAHLYTLGLAGEYVIGDFEWGFDAAKNFGHQTVNGWDRNQVAIENRLGNYTFVNSQVRTAVNDGGQTVVFVANSAAQKIINSVPQSASENNQLIGAGVVNPADPTGPTIDLYDSTARFRDPYKNTFKGWMATADAAYWLCDRQVRFAGALGYASGGENPNKPLNAPGDSEVDSDYTGFVPLQEIYSGDRVQSVFFLGGAGRAPRPLSLPNRAVSDTTPTTVSGFTNLIFTGASVLWSPQGITHEFNLRPNILAYWQSHATKAFDLLARAVSPDRYARNYLGVEANVFFDISLFTDFKFFTVGSVFLPGSHYKDIKGQPLSREQQRILDRLDVTGFDDASPLLSTDVSYTLNVGLEYRF